jgi:uncharacterized phage-associated protein
MTYSSASIANAFLNIAFSERAKITHMKIQKLVYLAHGYSLVERDQPLVDEFFEAWKFGPVLPSLYQACKKFGKEAISHLLSDSGYGILSNSAAAPPDNLEVQKILNFVWKNYGLMDAIELSAWTHEKDGPWDKEIHKAGMIFRNQPIKNEIIKEYFKNQMSADDIEKT